MNKNLKETVQNGLNEKQVGIVYDNYINKKETNIDDLIANR